MNKIIKATLVHSDKTLMQNKWFSENPEIVRDNINKCYSELKRQAFAKGIELCTEDINPLEISKLVIFVDVPARKYYKSRDQIWYLLLFEAPGVYRNNWEIQNHKNFDRIFTWNEDWVDNKKYFLLRLAYDLNIYHSAKDFNERKFLTMIAGAKSSKHSNSLYKARYDLIKWFSKFHHDEFDLYGFHWPKRLYPLFQSRFKKFIPKFLKKGLSYLFPKNKVYRGTISKKKEVLSNYKFSICYENIEGINGYITEKIFDSFCAGCVPVYWGAKNINELIPKNCFIDKREFNDNKDLYDYLKSISKDNFLQYQNNIKNYLDNKEFSPFSTFRFTWTLLNFILKDIETTNYEEN